MSRTYAEDQAYKKNDPYAILRDIPYEDYLKVLGKYPVTIPNTSISKALDNIGDIQRILDSQTGILSNSEERLSPTVSAYSPNVSQPYFTMEGALMPAPQMSELEKLMQLSRQQAGR